MTSATAVRLWTAALLGLAAAGCTPGGGPGPVTVPGPAGPAPSYAWVQATTGGWGVRAIYPATVAGCPAPLSVRARPDSLFPVVVCQAPLPAGGSITIGGQTFSAPSGWGGGVVAMGDTGCRVKGSAVQNCADSTAWPFPGVARRAAAERPSVVVHVGDYHYREQCASSECGYGWNPWQADFFDPARPLLQSSAWVFARGNHESCDRAGQGWFRFLDARPVLPDSAGECVYFTDPFAVDLPGVGRILILDTSCAPSYATCGLASTDAADTVAIRRLTADVRMMARQAEGAPAAWIATHTPLWGIDDPAYTDATGSMRLRTAVHQAIGDQLPANVGLFLAGHTHLWEVLSFGGARPATFVVGNGGTMEDNVQPPPVGQVVDGLPLAAYWSTLDFGFSLLRPDGAGIGVRMITPDGSASATCAVTRATGANCTLP